MLPEIVGKWYSRRPVADCDGVVHEPVNEEDTTNDLNKDDKSTPWCYCNEPSREMILCDNKGCSIKWFHFTCLRIIVPRGKWYSPSCRNLPKFNKQSNSLFLWNN